MISWLKGEIINKWKISSKKGVVLNVNCVGYEIQLLPKQMCTAKVSNEIELWINQIDREDGTSLYGFIQVIKEIYFERL